MKNKFLHYGLVLTLIAGITAGLLGFVNKTTAPIIAIKALEKENKARKSVLNLADKFMIDKKQSLEKLNFIPGYKNGKKVGYVVSVSSPGYAGDIKFVLGIDLDGVITGMKITESKETPGLGAKIQKETKKDGKKILWTELWKKRTKAYKFNKSVDAFAGATISPMAVYDGIQKTLNVFEKLDK